MSEVETPIDEDRPDNPGTVAKGQCELQPNESADGPTMSAAQVLMGKLIAKADIESSDSVYLSRFGLPERQTEDNKDATTTEPTKEEHKFTDDGKARMALLVQTMSKTTQNEKPETPSRSVWAPVPVITKNETTDEQEQKDPKVRVAPKSESFDNAQDLLRARATDKNKQEDNSILRSKGTAYHSSGNVSSIVRNPAPVVRPQPDRPKLQDFPTYTQPEARSTPTSTTPTPTIRTVNSGTRISHLVQPTVTPNTSTNPTVIPRISPNPSPKPVQTNPYSTPYPNIYVHPHNNSFPTSPNVVPMAAASTAGGRTPYVVPPAAYGTAHAPPSNIRQHVYPASPTHSQAAHPPAKSVGRSTSAPSVSSAALLHQQASTTRPAAHSHINHYAAYPNTRPLA